MRDSTDEADGGLCWNASKVLANYLVTTQPGLVGTTVLEFGSGTGALAARLSAAGVRVVCTDCDLQIDYLSRRMQGVAHTTVLPLNWGDAGWETGGGAVLDQGPYSAIIMAELYGLVQAHDVLLATLLQACSAVAARRHASPGKTEPVVVWSIFKNRPFSLNFLGLLHDTGAFEWEMIEEFDRMGMEEDPGDELFLHRLVYIGDPSGGSRQPQTSHQGPVEGGVEIGAQSSQAPAELVTLTPVDLAESRPWQDEEG